MRPLSRAGTLAEKALKRLRRKQNQEKFPKVVVQGKMILVISLSSNPRGGPTSTPLGITVIPRGGVLRPQ